MKKFYSPTPDTVEKTSDDLQESRVPRPSTIAFLRQFARCYCPIAEEGMPGFVLN